MLRGSVPGGLGCWTVNVGARLCAGGTEAGATVASVAACATRAS
jgi:hypothetical protein